MKKLYLIHCRGLGDILSATPSLRKLSKSYGEKIDVVSYSPELFKNNPYVNKVFSWEDDVDKIKSEYQEEGIFNTSNGYQLNHSFDIRALHAKYLGFGLLPEEMEYDFIPDKYKDLNLPLNYICIHPALNWESRTWPQEKWQELIDHLISLGYFVVVVGKDDTRIEDGEWGKKSGLKYIFNFKEHPNLINFTNKANLSQTWHIINRAEKFVTMDTGLLHLAGCTNVEIIQLGSSINYKFRAPFRMGSQEYRYTYVGGDCDIFCASDLKYAVKEHGKFNVTPPLWKCLESKETFECHPSVEKVSKLFSPAENCLVQTSFVDGAFCQLSGNFSGKRKVSFIDNENNQLVYQTSLPCHHWAKPSKKTFVDWRIEVEKENGEIIYKETFNAENKKVLISFDSSSVGDTIAWIPYVEQFRIRHNCIIFCQTFHNSLLRESYPNINFISHNETVDCYASYELGWFEDWENTDRNPNDPRSIPLQQTASDILGLEYREVRPRLQKKDRPRNLKEKYVCISIASTAGLKHWQNESGWQQTVDYLSELGYKVVVVQKEPLGWMDTPSLKNVIHPEAADLEQAASWIQHCEFFIGLGSGISWLAWALNKKVILISGFSKKFAEFETPYRVQSLEVCNGCWNDTRHKFDKGDWSWCPEDKNFECSKSITFKFVKEQIDKIMHNKKNKIGIQFLAYNCQKSFKDFISPWLKLKSKYDLYFFVGSTQFTLYKELGYEDKNTETVRMLQSEYNHVIDHLYSPEESKTEEEVRNRCLELFKEKGIDIMWAVDSDEFFTEEEVEGIIQFVKENEQYDWFQVKYKNYIGDGSGWIDFEAPRIWRIKANSGVSHFYRDCWVTYNNNKECREANWKTIPEEVARPKHMSWVEGFEESRPSNAKAKVDYQIANYGEDWGCSFKWDDEENKLSLNKDWYKAHQEKMPEVHYDNEIDLNFDFFYHEDGGPHGNLKPAPDFKITFNSNRDQAYEIIIRDKRTKNIFRYYKNYKAEKNIKYYISIGPRYELISQVKQIEVIFTDQQGNIVFKETILNDALNQKYEKISKKTFYDQEVDLKKNSLINKDVYLEMRKVIDGKCHGDKGNLEGMGLMYYSIINLLKPRNILCIGSGDGYVPCLIRQAQRDLKIEGKTYLVDADLPELGFGGPSYLEDGSALKTAYPEIEIITETSCQAYENVFKDVELDYIHIDADHSYEGVKSDFYNYINSLSQNGVVTLHDTRVYGWPDEHSVMMRVFEGWTAVPTFLEELKKDKSFEIINFDQFGSGTAIVKRKSLSVKEANASDKIESFEGSPLLKV
tara:strand:- start:779 stop:4660 length:3882 start_codon:yes stop_codon:yes gene_type:complete